MDQQALIKDVSSISPAELAAFQHASMMSLDEILPLLRSPDTSKTLAWNSNFASLSDGSFDYPVLNGSPVLYPAYAAELLKGMVASGVELECSGDSRLQYFLLSKIKQAGEITASHENVHAQRHFHRMREFVTDLSGSVLDVGCDNVALSSSLFPESCRYVGLDPFCQSAGVRIIGVGESLPFKSGTFDNVVFNTSLDHILDYYLALKEARRVLKPGGTLVLVTLCWTDRESLLSDSVHFHHFKRYEINGALQDLGFDVVAAKNYSYKDDEFRYGLYLKAKKRDDGL
jgi:hypothetical protein